MTNHISTNLQYKSQNHAPWYLFASQWQQLKVEIQKALLLHYYTLYAHNAGVKQGQTSGGGTQKFGRREMFVLPVVRHPENKCYII